jgi:hypothetical protein
MTIGAGLVVVGLAKVRSSTAGRYVDPALEPEDPGYAAFVTPTPTLLVVHKASENQLAGLVLLSLLAGDEGGSVMVLPVGTRLPYGEGSVTLADAYAAGDPRSVADLAETILGVAIHDVVEIGDDRWASRLDPLGELELNLASPLGEWAAGAVVLQPEDVGRFLSTRNEGESELARAERQEEFWSAWVEAVAESDATAVSGETESGLGRFLRALAAGPATVASLPVAEVSGTDVEQFSVDDEMLASFVAQNIPFPESPAPGVRPRVRLLNGTTDRELNTLYAELLVEAGAEVAISGNARSFDEPMTRIVYYDEDQRAAAESLRDGMGIGVVEAELIDDDAAPLDEAERIEVTVILGGDAPEAIGR